MNNIKHYRIAASISQQDLANSFAVSRQTISRWENDHSDPSIETWIKLAHTFQVSVHELKCDNFAQKKDVCFVMHPLTYCLASLLSAQIPFVGLLGLLFILTKIKSEKRFRIVMFLITFGAILYNIYLSLVVFVLLFILK